MSFSSGPGFLELFNIVQYCNTKESDCDFLVDPGFLEVDNSVQYCNTKESDCDFLVDPGFLVYVWNFLNIIYEEPNI